MIRRLAIVAVLTVGSSMAALPAVGVEVSVEALLRQPAVFEGEVTVVGELVGDYGFRNDGWVWAQLNDDSYARTAVLEGGALDGGNIGVGVRMRPDVAESLDPPGGYRLVGPLVEITGTWVYHDPGRGGESYIEVESLVVVDRGRALAQRANWPTFAVGAVLLVLAAGLWSTRPRPD